MGLAQVREQSLDYYQNIFLEPFPIKSHSFYLRIDNEKSFFDKAKNSYESSYADLYKTNCKDAKADLYEEDCEDGKEVTEEEYWEFYYEHPQYRYEYNNGKLEVKGMSSKGSYKSGKNMTYFVDEYLKNNDKGTKGETIGQDVGFRLQTSPTSVSIRKPDLAIILQSNPVQIPDDDRTYKGIYDLCIEMLSDSTKKVVENDTKVKVSEYSAVGVKEYYIIDSRKTHKYTQFYKLDPNGFYSVIQPINGVIESQALPGFKFKIDDLYKDTLSLDYLINDDVYKGYVALEYQAERTRAEAEHMRAEAERTRAETERTRAETERKRAESAEQAKEAERKRAESAEQAKEVERTRAEAERTRAESAEQAKEVERTRAEAERTRAEAERKRAESAEQAKEVERTRAESAEQAKEAERKRAESAEQAKEVERTRAESAEQAKEAERKRAESAEQAKKAERKRAKKAEKRAQKAEETNAKILAEYELLKKKILKLENLNAVA